MHICNHSRNIIQLLMNGGSTHSILIAPSWGVAKECLVVAIVDKGKGKDI